MQNRLNLISTRKFPTEKVREWALRGLDVQVHPLIKSEFLPVVLPEDTADSLVVFTSKNGVKGLFSRGHQKAINYLEDKIIASISPSTSALLGSYGVPIDCMGENAKNLAKEIVNTYSPRPVRYFCSPTRREELPQVLHTAGFSLSETHVYQTHLLPKRIDWAGTRAMLFFSPSAVTSYFQANSWPQEKLAFAIGPATTETLEHHQVPLIRTAAHPSMDSLLHTIISTFRTLSQ